MFKLLVDHEIELRVMDDADAVAFHRLNSTDNANMQLWLPARDTERTLEETREFIQELRRGFDDNKGLAAGIWYNGQLAGFVDAQRIVSRHKKTEIGYWLGTSFEGRGIMTRACRAIIDYNFGEFDLNRIEIKCPTDNLQSRRIPERLGFTQEGIIRQVAWLNDRFVDYAMYGLLTDEWRQQRERGK